MLRVTRAKQTALDHTGFSSYNGHSSRAQAHWTDKGWAPGCRRRCRRCPGRLGLWGWAAAAAAEGGSEGGPEPCARNGAFHFRRRAALRGALAITAIAALTDMCLL